LFVVDGCVAIVVVEEWIVYSDGCCWLIVGVVCFLLCWWDVLAIVRVRKCVCEDVCVWWCMYARM